MKFIALILLLASVTTSFGQVLTENKGKYIQVAGSAEMEVVPDELYFVIVLKEYMIEKKRVQIEQLEKQLQSSVTAAGVSKENFTLENIFGQDYYWPPKKKEQQTEFLASKSYIIKLSDPSRIDAIMEKIDPKGINQVNIRNTDHSKIETFRRDLKIKALQNAKDKAKYLLEGIGEQLGEAILVEEVEMPNYGPIMQANTYMRAEAMDQAVESEVGFKKIKLRYEVRAQFKIK